MSEATGNAMQQNTQQGATDATLEPQADKHAKMKGAGILAAHPQRQQIARAILAGESTRSIAAWTKPPVTHVTVSRLAQHVLTEKRAAELLYKAQQMESVAAIINTNGMTPDKVAELAVAGNQHIAELKRIYAPLARQVELADAENDRPGLASVAKAAISAIRTQMEADGTLSQPSGPQVTVNSQVIVLPSFATDELEPAIDVQPERVR